MIPFDTQNLTLRPPEQLQIDLNDFQRSLYSCYSTGNVNEIGSFRPSLLNDRFVKGSLDRNNPQIRNPYNLTHENSHRTNILGPKHFIVEEENEALLAKELQEAKIQSAHNSHSSMHSSQPQIFHLDSNNFSMKTSTVKLFFVRFNDVVSFSSSDIDRSLRNAFQIFIIAQRYSVVC